MLELRGELGNLRTQGLLGLCARRFHSGSLALLHEGALLVQLALELGVTHLLQNLRVARLVHLEDLPAVGTLYLGHGTSFGDVPA